MLIDTHAHIYHHRLENDLPSVLERAREAGIARIIMPAIDVASMRKALELCDQYEGLYAMAALHPTETKDASDQDFATVANLCEDPCMVAVGESGLDYYWDRSFDAVQEDFFRRHIRLALARNLPLIIHMRDKKGREEVHREVVRILREERETSRRMRGIFHCFTGPAWMADAAAELGFMLGLGGAITFKNAGVDVLARTIPMDQIVLETDAPFLAPAPYRGKRNEPAYVRLVAQKLAEVKEMSVDDIVQATTANALRLFGIDG